MIVLPSVLTVFGCGCCSRCSGNGYGKTAGVLLCFGCELLRYACERVIPWKLSDVHPYDNLSARARDDGSVYVWYLARLLKYGSLACFIFLITCHSCENI